MIDLFKLHSTLQGQIVLRGVSKRTMKNLRKRILAFEEEFLSVDKIPIKKAKEYLRLCIIEESSDLLEDRRMNKIVIRQNQHPELYNIWKLEG